MGENSKVIENPEKYVALLGSYVEVTTKYTPNTSFTGFLLTVDPISESIILTKVCGDKTNTIVVMGHAVDKIIPREAPSTEKPEPKKEIRSDPETVMHEKDEVLNWLLKNLLPVEDKDETLHIRGDQMIIPPPYRPEDCISSNPIILGRIQHLLRSIPKAENT